MRFSSVMITLVSLITVAAPVLVVATDFQVRKGANLQLNNNNNDNNDDNNDLQKMMNRLQNNDNLEEKIPKQSENDNNNNHNDAYLRQLALLKNPRLLQAGSDWVQVGGDIDGKGAGEQAGISVSMSADGLTIAMGANKNNDNGQFSGNVRVFRWTSNTWNQVGQDITGKSAEDYSGFSVSLSADGTRVAIGAYGNDDGGVSSGHVRVYNLVGTTWTQLGPDIKGEKAGEQSGLTVSLSGDGNRVATGNSKTARVYNFVSTASPPTWEKMGMDLDGNSTMTAEDGISVSLSTNGGIVAVGSSTHNNANGIQAGLVRVYKWNETSWIQQGQDLLGAKAEESFGYSVSLSSSGERLAVGAPLGGALAGQTQIYKWTNNTVWDKIGQDINGEKANDSSGYSVALSGDGNRVAVGAILNDGVGTNAGHVRVHEDKAGLTWSQMGKDIDGESINDYSGCSVAMSSNGNRVVIGAYGNFGTGVNQGHARVYEYISRSNPTSMNKNITAGKNTRTFINLASFVADSENNVDPSSLTIDLGPLNGKVEFNKVPGTDKNDGTVYYTPNKDYLGVDLMIYKICDSDGLCASGDVFITVINRSGPDAVDDIVMTKKGATELINVTANDKDADGNLDITSITLIKQPTFGELTNKNDGTFEFSLAKTNTTGIDTFVYQICDTDKLCDIATVVVDVEGDPPGTTPPEPTEPPVRTPPPCGLYGFGIFCPLTRCGLIGFWLGWCKLV